MRRLAATLLLLCGCSPGPGEKLDALFQRTQSDFYAGDLERAQKESEQGMAQAAAIQDSLRQWKFRVLHGEVLLFRGHPEVVLQQLSEAIPPGREFARLAARTKLVEAQAHSILRHAAACNALLDEAQRDAKAMGAEDLLSEVENVRGSVLIFRGQFNEAEQNLRSALARGRSLKMPNLEAGPLLNLGRIRMAKLHYDEAAPYFEQASAVAGPQYVLPYSAAQDNLAICYKNLGEMDRAIAIQLEGIGRHERSGARFYLPGALAAVGDAYLSSQRLQDALPYLQQALSLAIETNRTSEAAAAAGNLSSVYVELGDLDKAAALNEEAIRLKETVERAKLYYNELNAANIAAAKGDAAARELFRRALAQAEGNAAVQWAAHEGLGSLAAKQHDPAGAAKEFEAALDTLEKARADVSRAEFKLPFLTSRIRLYQEYIDLLIGQGQVERALAVADSSHAQVLGERSGSTAARRLPAGSFRSIARDHRAVLLAYWLGKEQSRAWVVTADEIHQAALPGAKTIEPLVAAYQEAIERQLADPLRTRVEAGEKLYTTLVAPVRAWIPAGSRVVVVPDGALHAVNLEALPVPGETPHYWIEDVTLEIAPSLATLAGVEGRGAGGSRRLLLLGDPDTADADYPRLVHAAREIENVRRQFLPADQVVLTRASATPQAYLAAAHGAFAAVHFTAHAVANRQNPLESAVLLSGAKLYARDVMDAALDADLVTVSACRGAGSRTYSGEGLVGFAWAFLRAGARSVVAGLWDVNDQSTADLMDALYRGLAAGKHPVEALRSAKLAMVGSKGNLHKPYYWAPFELYTVAP